MKSSANSIRKSTCPTANRSDTFIPNDFFMVESKAKIRIYLNGYAASLSLSIQYGRECRVSAIETVSIDFRIMVSNSTELKTAAAIMILACQ